MTTIKLPTLEEAEATLPAADKARINRVGRRVKLAQAFAVKYLGLSEITVEDLLGLTDYLRESVQRMGASTDMEVDAPEPAEELDGLPEIRPNDAFFGSPQCNDPKCGVHDPSTPDIALRNYIAKIVQGLRAEMHPMMYAKIIGLLEDPRTELVRTPLGILLRAAPKPQSTPPSGNPELN